MDAKERVNQNPEVEIFPLGKWKRILAFLADFFLTFIIAITLFHLGTFQLGKLFVNFDGRINESVLAQKQRDSVLYGHGLLLYPSPDKREATDFTSNLDYTFHYYLYEYVKIDETIPEYEDKAGEVLHHYYVDIRQDESAYKAMYSSLDTVGFFDLSTMTLKAAYREEFKHALIKGDELSEQGQKDYDEFLSKIFLKGYNRMIDDILQKDLVYEGVSYKEKQQIVSETVNLERNLILIAALVAYLLSVSITCLVIPLIGKSRRTLAMLFMRNERIDSTKLVVIRKRRVLICFVYAIAANMAGLFFIPLGVYDFTSLFALPVLLPVSLISLAFILGSFIYLLFEPYNRTLSDRLTNTVMVSEATLDEIYRAKGYHF